MKAQTYPNSFPQKAEFLKSRKFESNHLFSLVRHFNSDLKQFKSPFVRLESLMVNVPPENKPLTLKLACTVLQFVVKLIPQDHIRNLLIAKILPTIFESLFESGIDSFGDKIEPGDGLSYDFVEKVTLGESQDDLLLQVKIL